MRALTYCSPITLILVILVTSPLLATAESDCREDPTQEQIDAGIKLFDYTAHYTDAFELGPKAIKRVEDCIRDCTRKQRSLVIKEILLRLQFREVGEDCTSSDEKYKYVLYNGDYNSADSTPYQAWQNELLDTGLIFCTPFKDLYCSPISKKCECRPGTFLSRFGTCLTDVGGFCWIPGVVTPERDMFPRLFDAYNNRDFHRDYSVISGTACEDYSLNRGDCTSRLKFFMHNICADKNLEVKDRAFEFGYYIFLKRLSFGDSCNFDHQTQLFTTTEEEVNDYTIRIKKLAAILEAKPSFCDHKRLLVCGSEGTCECMKPAIYNSETKLCTFRSPHEGCQAEGKFNKTTAGTFPGIVRQEMMSGFRGILNRECPVGCFDVTFPDGTLVEPNSQFCFTCGNVFFRVVSLGKNCDKTLTGFLEGAPPPSLPIDIPEYDKQLELFVQFNEKAKELQGLFRLEKNSPCDYEAEMDVIGLIRRIKNVEVPGLILTAEHYNDLMSSMDKHISGTTRFCSRELQLRQFVRRPTNPFLKPPPIKMKPNVLCGPTTPTATSAVCHEPTNAVYLDELVKRLSGKSFQATPATPTCSPHPRDIIQYAEEQFPMSRPSDANPNFVTTGLSEKAYEYLFNTLENLWIRSAQFCNRTGGFKCTKSVYDKTKVNATGKCDFSQDLLDEVQAELEQIKMEADRRDDQMSGLNISSKSCHHSIQRFLLTLFVILLIITPI